MCDSRVPVLLLEHKYIKVNLRLQHSTTGWKKEMVKAIQSRETHKSHAPPTVSVCTGTFESLSTSNIFFYVHMDFWITLRIPLHVLYLCIPDHTSSFISITTSYVRTLSNWRQLQPRTFWFTTISNITTYELKTWERHLIYGHEIISYMVTDLQKMQPLLRQWALVMIFTDRGCVMNV
jgi:hypothetical protein